MENVFLVETGYGFAQKCTRKNKNLPLFKELCAISRNSISAYIDRPWENRIILLLEEIFKNKASFTNPLINQLHYQIARIVHVLTHVHKTTPSPKLQKQLLNIAKLSGMPPVLTYFLVILNNQDPKNCETMTGDQNEVNFIQVHLRIEKSLSPFILFALEISKKKNQNTDDVANDLLTLYSLLKKNLQQAIHYLGQIQKLVDPLFFYHKIRLVFLGINGYNGPSGAQSPVFSLIDILLFVNHLDKFHTEQQIYMHPGHRNFLHMISSWVSSKNLSFSALKHEKELNNLMHEARNQLELFRKKHLNIVHNYLTKQGGRYGTGGKTVGFLKELQQETKIT